MTGGEERVARETERVDTLLVGELVRDLRLDEPPALLLAVPHLRDHMVDVPAVDQIGREPDTRPHRDALGPRHRDEEQREVSAAADQPLRRWPMGARRPAELP